MVLLDWTVLFSYIAFVLFLGAAVGRGKQTQSEMFLAGRSLPARLATMSFVATIQSTATFIAGPEMVFRNDLRHLMRLTGSVTAAFVVAYFILPALYNAGKTTIYGVLESRFGRNAQIGASLVFLFGVFLSAGARLLIAGVAFAFVLFGEIHLSTVLTTIAIVGAVGTFYTACGGMRAVAWTDCMQAITYLAAALICVVALIVLIPVSWQECLAILESGGTTGRDKLRLFDWGWDISSDDTFWASLVGLCVFHVGSFSTQQDLFQRLLACRSAGAAQAALLRGILLIFVSSWVFALIGLLLFVFFQSSGLVVDDSRKVFPKFIVEYLPMGLRGVVVTGIFAAAISSLDSVVNSMATCIMCDLGFLGKGEGAQVASGTGRYRWIVAGAGILLVGVASVLAMMQQKGGRELFDFAVMSAFYGISGLLGVFLVALFCKRGNEWSANFGLLAGGLTVGACALLPKMGGPTLGFPWWIVAGAAASFLVCFTGSNRARKERDSA